MNRMNQMNRETTSAGSFSLSGRGHRHSAV